MDLPADNPIFKELIKVAPPSQWRQVLTPIEPHPSHSTVKLLLAERVQEVTIPIGSDRFTQHWDDFAHWFAKFQATT